MSAATTLPKSVLSSVRKGRVEAPPRMTFAGLPGVGKSTLASHAPSPIFLPVEEGSDQLDVARLPRPASWTEAVDFVRALSVEAHEYKTFVIDTLDALEALATRHVCERAKKETLADFDWGKGNIALSDQWRILIHGLEALRAKGMGIILLAHVHVKAHNDPQLGPYDRYTPKLAERVWALTNEWSDLVAFLQFETALYEKKGERSRGMVTGNRVMRTVRGTGYDAKNRYSLPATLPLDWGALSDAIAQHGVAPEVQLRARLTTLLVDLDDAEVSARAHAHLKTNGENAQTLAEAINAVEFRMNEKKEKATK